MIVETTEEITTTRAVWTSSDGIRYYTKYDAIKHEQLLQSRRRGLVVYCLVYRSNNRGLKTIHSAYSTKEAMNKVLNSMSDHDLTTVDKDTLLLDQEQLLAEINNTL